MKISSANAARPPLSRNQAVHYLLLNQFATPGLGSLLARRFLAGLVQLVVFLAGFICMVGWFIQRSIDAYRLVNGLPEEPPRIPHLGLLAAGLAVAGWLLAWFTSLRLLREARQHETSSLPPVLAVPPKLKP